MQNVDDISLIAPELVELAKKSPESDNDTEFMKKGKNE